jgi:hypothetical protein
MAVIPVPARGGVVIGRDRPARALRVSAHPELSRVVLSLWDGNRCIGTLRLAPEDVPDVVHAPTSAMVPASQAQTVQLHAVPPAS